MKILVVIFIAVFSSITVAAPEAVVHTFIKAYAKGDVIELAGTLSNRGTHNGISLDRDIMAYDSLFNRHEGQTITLYDVVVSDNYITAWMVVSSEKLCGGPLDMWINQHGHIQRMLTHCSADLLKHESSTFDPAFTGQAMDVATTVGGIAMGATELNPIVAAAPVVSVAKLATSYYAETLSGDDCRQLKNGAAAAGWGAAGWNLCVLATVGSGGIAAPCLAAGIITGSIAYNQSDVNHIMRCRATREGRKFTRIDKYGIFQ